MTTHSFAPRTGEVLGTVGDTAPDDVAAVVSAAASAAAAVAAATPSQRKTWIDAIADAVEANSAELVELADAETALGVPRLTGEVHRVAEQLRFYARVGEDGGYLGVIIDDATEIAPRLVRVNRPLGPVAVFGASNFPFAFGVLGNDTASALAAGCPVVAKAHPAHALTCVRLAEIADVALASVGAPAGIFGMVHGMQSGVALVEAEGIKAVGFTGSQNGGLSLWRIANARETVIPVYAEMGTVNPVVLTSRGVEHLDEVAAGFVGSFTLGAGQFCSKPGLLFAPAGSDAAQAVAHALEKAELRPRMLTESIARNVATSLTKFIEAGATLVARVDGGDSGWAADSAVLSAPISALRPGSALLEECFGPVAVVTEYATHEELVSALRVLQGSLAGSVFGAGADDTEVADAVEALEGQVGRVTVGDWPTGVAWGWAQQHGGPWPATSNPASTSVGGAALERFVRPVAFQSVPDSALPLDVRAMVAEDNPLKIPRRINGAVVPT